MLSASAKLIGGVSVNVVGPPVTVAATGPLIALLMENQEPEMLTGWLNVTVIGALPGTFTAPFVGVVETIAGAIGGALTGVVNVRSSMPIPSSLPVSSTSLQRSTSTWPGAQLRPVTVDETAVRFSGEMALPSSATLVPVVLGAVKFSPAKVVNVPVLM